MSDFNITLYEACEHLNKSKKTISRYIRQGKLHPRRIKSKQGTLEYRFNKADLEAFRAKEDSQSGQDTPAKTTQDSADKTRPAEIDKTGQEANKEKTLNNRTLTGKNRQERKDTPPETRPDQQPQTGRDSQVIELLKETTGMLREQLGKKDEQISSLSETVDQLVERDRETNVLLKGLQDKILMLEPPKSEETGQTTEQVKSKADKTGRDEVKAGFWQRAVKWYKTDV